MASASPLLTSLLDQWNEKRADARRAAGQLIDQTRAEFLPVDDAFIQLRAAHRTHIDLSEHAAKQKFSRHVEHLRHLESSKQLLQGLAERFAPLVLETQSMRWLTRVDAASGTFSRRMLLSAERLAQRYAEMHQRLEEFDQLLNNRTESLQEFKQKATDRAEPLLVSRGRKTPEVEFLNFAIEEQAAAGAHLQRLRRSLSLALNRIYRAIHTVERRAKANPEAFNPVKRRIFERFREPQEMLFQLREKIMADALFFEGTRRKLKWVQEAVRNMRCLEDVYKPPKNLWQRVFSAETLARSDR